MTSKLNWSQEQQEYLAAIKSEVGGNYWCHIAKAVNAKFPNKNRNGKQCRQRYVNFLMNRQDTHTEKDWTSFQIETLINNFSIFGSKWVEISKKLSGRSENSAKNKFYCLIRKLLRILNIYKENNRNFDKKEIKLSSLLKILYFKSQETFIQNYEPIKQLKRQILSVLSQPIQSADSELLLQISCQIRKLNWQFRYVLLSKGGHKKTKKVKNIGFKKENKFEQESQQMCIYYQEDEKMKTNNNSNEKKMFESEEYYCGEQNGKFLNKKEIEELMLMGEEQLEKRASLYNNQKEKSLLTGDNFQFQEENNLFFF